MNLNGAAIHTTASCSFSSCRCRSAAVSGRGWRIGPGPGPTPVLSPKVNITGGWWGDGSDGFPALLTTFWFDGRMSREEVAGTGGGGICWEDTRRGWGEGGTELRSGMTLVELPVADLRRT